MVGVGSLQKPVLMGESSIGTILTLSNTVPSSDSECFSKGGHLLVRYIFECFPTDKWIYSSSLSISFN